MSMERSLDLANKMVLRSKKRHMVCFVDFHPVPYLIIYGVLWATFFSLFSFPGLFRPVLACAYPLRQYWLQSLFNLMVIPGISWKPVEGCPVPCMVFLCSFFYGTFTLLAKNTPCLSGVGEGEVEWKIYFSISLTNLLSGLESLPVESQCGFEHWLSMPIFECPHSHVRFSSGPSCFNERKAVRSHPLILETPSGWPGKFPFQ